jgi:hypothetical protein
MRKTFISFVLILGFATLASAQQRPLVTEDPETVGEHVVLIEGGMDYQHSIEYPVSGLEGNLLRLPTLGVSFGLGASAEFQIDGGLFDHLSVTSRRRAPLSGALISKTSQLRRKYGSSARRPAVPPSVSALPRSCPQPATRVASASTRPIS